MSFNLDMTDFRFVCTVSDSGISIEREGVLVSPSTSQMLYCGPLLLFSFVCVCPTQFGDLSFSFQMWGVAAAVVETTVTGPLYSNLNS